MRETNLNEILCMSANAREKIWRRAEEYGREPKIYLHWTGGKYDSLFEQYHVNITGEGTLYVATDDLADVLDHTWRRNSGAIGISLCCAYGAGECSLGSYPPTGLQIEAMAQVIERVSRGLWLTIDKNHVLTHGEAANNEDGGVGTHNPYAWWNYSYNDGDTRGDLEYLGTAESPRYNPWATDGSRGGDVLRGKAIWYRNKFS